MQILNFDLWSLLSWPLPSSSTSSPAISLFPWLTLLQVYWISWCFWLTISSICLPQGFCIDCFFSPCLGWSPFSVHRFVYEFLSHFVQITSHIGLPDPSNISLTLTFLFVIWLSATKYKLLESVKFLFTAITTVLKHSLALMIYSINNIE